MADPMTPATPDLAELRRQTEYAAAVDPRGINGMWDTIIDRLIDGQLIALLDRLAAAEAELAALRAAGRGDDGEPVTEEWLRSIGFKPRPNDNGSLRMAFPMPEERAETLYMEIDDYDADEPAACVWLYHEGDNSPVLLGQLPYFLTRGDVRRLLAALGLPPRSAGADAAPEDAPVPIGRCPKCGTPVYTDEGFCGVCGNQ